MTDTVEIAVSDLEMLRAALNSAFHHCTVVDLAEQYRKLTARPQASPLTKSLGNARDIVESYITFSQESDEPQPEG